MAMSSTARTACQNDPRYVGYGRRPLWRAGERAFHRVDRRLAHMPDERGELRRAFDGGRTPARPGRVARDRPVHPARRDRRRTCYCRAWNAGETSVPDIRQRPPSCGPQLRRLFRLRPFEGDRRTPALQGRRFRPDRRRRCGGTHCRRPRFLVVAKADGRKARRLPDGEGTAGGAGPPLLRRGREHLRPPAEGGVAGGAGFVERSEEHTSELQSLMRNSYSVFWFKKKKTIR